MPARRMRLALPLVALLAAISLLLVLLPWLSSPGEQPLAAPEGPATASAASGELSRATSSTASGAQAPADPQRFAADTPVATTGSLLLRVVWGDDKLPATDIAVEVHRSGIDSLLDTPRGRTDAAGTCLFADLAPGIVYPQIARGGHGGGSRVEIVAGQQAGVTLEVTMGMNANGRVVDERGAPVAGATIVLSDWGGGTTQTLACSAADGTFSLRAVPTHCHIGARKAGHVPSSMRQFTAGDGATVTFTIVLHGGGGALSGVVLDPQGQPVGGAVVRAGEREQKNHKLPDGANAMAPQAEQLRTDDAGRFVFDSVVPGSVPLAVRARGLAPWQQDVEVAAGRTTEVTVRLLPGVTLFGTVRDAANTPLAKVEIETGDWDDLSRRSVRSAADGSYRLEGLAAGTMDCQANHDQYGKARTSLQPAPGETVRWDPVLSAGLQLRGRVLDDEGKPVAKVMIEGMLERPSRDDRWWGHENTDAEGRFVLKNCIEGRTLRISARRQSVFPELVLKGVLPGSEELVIRLPAPAWVHIEGTVLGPDDKPLANVHVSPFQKDGGSSPAESANPETGAFRYGPYPPGEYSMTLRAAGFPTIRVPPRTLGPNETWNVGTLRFQAGGTLAVQLVTTTTPPPTLSLSIHDADGRSVERFELKDGQGRSGPLVPGNYALHVGSAAIASAVHAFEVRAGVETRIDVPAQAGVPTTIVCELPAGAARDTGVQVVVRDTAGIVVLRSTAWPRGSAEAPSLPCALLPGQYAVEATRDGLRGAAEVAVAAPGPVRTTVALAPQ